MDHYFLSKMRHFLVLVVLFLGVLYAASGTQVAATAVAGDPLDLTSHIFLPMAANVSSDNSVPDGPLQIYAYSDAAVLQPNMMLQLLLTAQKPLLCQATAAPQPLTLEQALQNGWNYLAQQVGAGNLNMFRQSSEVATAPTAQAFAMAAMADNRPDGALAGLLQAHQHNSNSPIILVNAAGMFGNLNMPNEALALLAAAAALPGPMETPMGIPGEELAANAQGYALLALGQWAAAEAVLRPLTEDGTELSEARLNLSKALLCQDEDEEAVRFYRLGSRRMMWDVVEYGEEVEGIRIPVELTLNRSAGKLFTLPPLGVMNNPGQAFPVWQHTNTLINESIARTSELNHLMDANAALRQARPLPSPITVARFNNIYITALRALYEPDIQALYQAAADQETAMNELRDEQDEEWLALAELFPDWEAYIVACRSTVTSHLTSWLNAYFQFENMLESYTVAKYAAMTGTAANLSDPLNHEFVSLMIEHEMEGDIAWRLHALNGHAATIWAHWSYCEGVEESIQEQPSEPTFDWASQCPNTLTRNKLAITILGMLQIRANCEVLEAELAGPSLLTVFGQITVDYKNKTTTFFAGGKIKGPVGLAELGINEGFYVSVGEKGITDLGMKVSSSIDVKAGQFAGVISGPEIEFGVAPAIEYLSGVIGP